MTVAPKSDNLLPISDRCWSQSIDRSNLIQICNVGYNFNISTTWCILKITTSFNEMNHRKREFEMTLINIPLEFTSRWDNVLCSIPLGEHISDLVSGSMHGMRQCDWRG